MDFSTHFVRSISKRYEKEVADLYLKGSTTGAFGRSFLIKCFEDIRDSNIVYRNDSHIKKFKFKENFICNFMKRFNLTVPGLSKRIAGEKRPPTKTVTALRLSKSLVSDEIQIEEIGISSGHFRVFSLFGS